MSVATINPADIEIGVVGIGLMGSSIITCLLISGHKVKALAPIEADYTNAKERITGLLNNSDEAGLLDHGVNHYLSRLEITMDYGKLANCSLVLECVIENINIKAKVYKAITDVVAPTTILASNTSAIAITLLQGLVEGPERFLGIHFAEPAYATRFLEITCGEHTNREMAEWVFNLAHNWGKEPTLLRKDIRGFITNRLMYAVYREIFHLIDSGQATMEDADKAFRYDAGSWVTLMGLFRRMDYLGLKDFETIFTNLFPQLSNTNDVPGTMQQMVDNHSRGIQNLDGLYNYTSKEAKEWDEAFAAFNTEIFNLAAKYPSPEREKILV